MISIISSSIIIITTTIIKVLTSRGVTRILLLNKYFMVTIIKFDNDRLNKKSLQQSDIKNVPLVHFYYYHALSVIMIKIERHY